MFSGGTLVIVTGSNLASVAEPRINLTVVITRLDNNTISATSNSEVLISNILKLQLVQCNWRRIVRQNNVTK